MSTVLVVDDDSSFRKSFLEGMEDVFPSVKFLAAANGLSAIDILGNHDVDLIITDIKMPKMDGIELLSYLSREFPYLPVVVMTAFGTSKLREAVSSYNAMEFIEKPLNLKEMQEIIARILFEPASTESRIQQISLAAFAQIVEMDRMSRLLAVSPMGNDENRKGFLWFKEGNLIHAKCGPYEGLEAAYVIFSWDRVRILVKDFPNNSLPSHTIDIPLQNVIMEAMRLKDEGELPDNKWKPNHLYISDVDVSGLEIFEEKNHHFFVSKSTQDAKKIVNNDAVASLDKLVSEQYPKRTKNSQFTQKEITIMSIREKLQPFALLEDFAGVALFTPTGEILAKLPAPDSPFVLDKVGVLANNVLINAQKATKELDDGVAQLLTINAERAQILVYCFNEGEDPIHSEPGKAHIHLVLVLTSDASLGMAKMRIPSLIRQLADDFRM